MRLTKHQGLGNDFLVLLDLDGSAGRLPALARAACDRRRGIGADGLLHAIADADRADVVMALYNADGSRAEMSGNGIACLAQAVVMAGLAGPDRVEVATDAGRRSVDVCASESPRGHQMRVDMGSATAGESAVQWVEDDVLAAIAIDIGNPHIVLRVDEPTKFAIDDVGRRICGATPGGTNVEAIAPTADGGLTMVVYERGVGVTEACGTGACASAVAAARWGLTGDRVTVSMPGGDADVEIGRTDLDADVEIGPTVIMTTTVVHIADIEFQWP